MKRQLERRARRKARSLQQGVRKVRRAASDKQEAPADGLGSRIAKLFANMGFKGDIPELHGKIKGFD